MRTFLFTFIVCVFAFCQTNVAANVEVPTLDHSTAAISEPYIYLAGYSEGVGTFYAYLENKPEGTNFKWFISGDDWSCLYQYPDEAGAAFDYLGDAPMPSRPDWIWVEYKDSEGRNQRIFYSFSEP